MRTRVAVGFVIVLVAGTVHAKGICPSGRFVMEARRAAGTLPAGQVLALGAGQIELEGYCPATEPIRGVYSGHQWYGTVKARWSGCGASLVLPAEPVRADDCERRRVGVPGNPYPCPTP